MFCDSCAGYCHIEYGTDDSDCGDDTNDSECECYISIRHKTSTHKCDCDSYCGDECDCYTGDDICECKLKALIIDTSCECIQRRHERLEFINNHTLILTYNIEDSDHDGYCSGVEVDATISRNKVESNVGFNSPITETGAWYSGEDECEYYDTSEYVECGGSGYCWLGKSKYVDGTHQIYKKCVKAKCIRD